MADKPEAIVPLGPGASDKKASNSAGGIQALTSSMRHLRRESGMVRGFRILTNMNKPGGFDCPGCAWPDPDHRAIFEFCENGAKAVAEEATRARATPEVISRLSLRDLRTMTGYELGELGRITHPMISHDGSNYEEISWEDATKAVEASRSDLVADDHIFYTSGRASNEAAFLYQLLGRKLGTNNFPDCSNMCHESSGVGLTQTVGVGKGTVSLEDFDHADAIFIFGQNPGTNHPRMLTTLREAAKRGCQIVCINPLKEVGLLRFKHPKKPLDVIGKGVALASEYVQLKTGSDIYFIRGIGKHLLAWQDEGREVLDLVFIDKHCQGFAEYRVACDETSWQQIYSETGISSEQIERCAEIYAKATSSILCWAMGITQHAHGVANVREIVNLALLRGNLGRPGAGLCPVRGHSNVQGDRTVGINHHPSEEFLQSLDREFEMTSPRSSGLDTVGAIEAMREKPRAFFALGGNFLSAGPDTEVIAEALSRCQLTVHIATKLNRGHAYPGKTSLILPCLGRSELDKQAAGPQFVTVENSMSIVHRSQGKLTAASPHLRSEPSIIALLAEALLGEDWSAYAANYDAIRDGIEKTVPGFERFNHRIRESDGFVLPNTARDLNFEQLGGAKFYANPPPQLHRDDSELLLMTMRSHDQYNTTIYGLDDRYRGVFGGRDVIFVNQQDAERLGLTPEHRVDVSSHYGAERRVNAVRVIPYDIPEGCCAMYFPEANPLIPLSEFDAESRTPASKSIRVKLTPLT